jgi:hypothetical protein
MPMDEILRNSAPAIGGLLVTAAGLAYAHSLRGSATRRQAERQRPHPAK